MPDTRKPGSSASTLSREASGAVQGRRKGHAKTSDANHTTIVIVSPLNKTKEKKRGTPFHGWAPTMWPATTVISSRLFTYAHAVAFFVLVHSPAILATAASRNSLLLHVLLPFHGVSEPEERKPIVTPCCREKNKDANFKKKYKTQQLSTTARASLFSRSE